MSRHEAPSVSRRNPARHGIDTREQELLDGLAKARQRLDVRTRDLAGSIDRLVNPLQAVRRFPFAGVAAGLATGIAGGLLLSALRPRRRRGSGPAPAGSPALPDETPVGAEVLRAAIPLLAAWFARDRKDPGAS
jgi:hypothetical protein